MEECVTGRVCDYGMEGEGDVSNYIKVGAWLLITVPNLRTHSQPELFDCKYTLFFFESLLRMHTQSSESSVHIPCSYEERKSKYWSLNHQQLTEPNPCFKRQLTQKKVEPCNTYWFSFRPLVLIVRFFFLSELENLRLEG